MARYSFTVNYNDPNVGFQIQDAIARILDEAGEPPAAPTHAPSNGTPEPHPRFQSQPRQAPQQQQGASGPPRVRDPHAPPTEKQLGLIGQILSNKGITWDELYDYADERFQTQISEDNPLNRGQASQLIEDLDAGLVKAAAAPF